MGMFVGILSTFCILLTRKFSRRFLLIFTDLISIFGVVICILAVQLDHLFLLYIGRFICGITTGLNLSIIPIYIKEMSPYAVSEKTL